MLWRTKWHVLIQWTSHSRISSYSSHSREHECIQRLNFSIRATQKCPPRQHPHVIGLTGMSTVPPTKPANVLSVLVEFEKRFRAVIKTAQSVSVKDVFTHSMCTTDKAPEYEKHVTSESHEKLVHDINETIDAVDERSFGWNQRMFIKRKASEISE